MVEVKKTTFENVVFINSKPANLVVEEFGKNAGIYWQDRQDKTLHKITPVEAKRANDGSLTFKLWMRPGGQILGSSPGPDIDGKAAMYVHTNNKYSGPFMNVILEKGTNKIVDAAAQEASNFLKPKNPSEASDPRHDPNNLNYAADHIFKVTHIADTSNAFSIKPYDIKPDFCWQDLEGNFTKDPTSKICYSVHPNFSDSLIQTAKK